MRKGELLNGDIVEVIAKMGHTDEIVICDAGLPIPQECRRIDLALHDGTPSFIDTLTTLLKEYHCQEAYLASEIKENNSQLFDDILKILKDVPITYIDHESFKEKTKGARAIIRTGECTPYANIILKSDVIF